MTCKDCVHHNLCDANECLRVVTDIIDDYIDTIYLDNSQNRCSHFKNKADFVETPCRCKDCDHFINRNPDRTYCAEHSDGWGDNIVYVDEDDYCSFGIRKEGADNG